MTDYQTFLSKRLAVAPSAGFTVDERALHISTPPDGLVLDCFAGSGTTGVAARNLDRPCVLIEKDARYVAMIEDRLAVQQVLA